MTRLDGASGLRLRLRQVLEYRNQGLTFREIGEHIGVSGSRAQQLHRDALGVIAYEQAQEPPFFGLYVKAKTPLSRFFEQEGLAPETTEQAKGIVMDLIRTKKLRPSVIRGYGLKAHITVLTWVGLR